MLRRRTSSYHNEPTATITADDAQHTDYLADRRAVSVIPAADPLKGKKRVAPYCRVSTCFSSQETSIENQVLYYTDLVSRTPNWELADIYCDHGISATGKAEQQELERLLTDCKAGKVDIVITKSISRLARNTQQCLQLVRSLSSLDVRVIFERENLDTGKAGSEMMLSVLATIAEMESRSISSNVAWGIRKRFLDGSYKIPTPAYGYRRVGSTYSIHEAEGKVIRQIFDDALSGLGCSMIAAKLNEDQIPSRGGNPWQASSVMAIIKNVFYAGDVIHQKTYTDSHFKQRINKGERDKFMVEADHLALIDREAFTRANEMITKHARDYHNTPEDSLERKNRYIFSGKVCCGVCGSVMYREGNAYYRCRSQAKDAREVRSVYESDLRSCFATMLNKLSFAQENYDFFDVAFTDDNHHSRDDEAVQCEKDQLSHELDQVFHRIVAGHVDADLLVRKRLLESQLARLNGQAIKSSQASIEIQKLKRFVIQRGIQESFITEDEEAFTRFIEKVVAYPGMRYAFHFKCGLVLTETADRNAYRAAGLLQDLDVAG